MKKILFLSPIVLLLVIQCAWQRQISPTANRSQPQSQKKKYEERALEHFIRGTILELQEDYK
ncbi:MAG: hypothetical protein ONB05_08650, partial [candidate division KSB1 bacterium]|nr:hypothetical protein [candidate division KSB1 bacterium]